MRESSAIEFLLTHLYVRKEAPILRLRLPMLCRAHINHNLLQFLKFQRHLLQELCVPLRYLTPVIDSKHVALFQFAPKVYFVGREIHLDSARTSTRHWKH